MADVLDSRFLKGIKVEASLRFGTTRMKVAELIELSVGECLLLDEPMHEPLNLVIDGHVVARGVLVQSGQQRMLKLTAVATADGSDVATQEPDPKANTGSPAPAEVARVDAGQIGLEALAALPHGAPIEIIARWAGDDGQALLASLRSASATEELSAWFNEELPRHIQSFVGRVSGGDPDEATLRKEWVDAEFVVLLDRLAEIHTLACTDAFMGHEPAGPTAERLAKLIYFEVGAACLAEGWFSLTAVVPYETAFDENVHEAAGPEVRVKGAKGLVVKVESVGRVNAEGEVICKPKVLVGR